MLNRRRLKPLGIRRELWMNIKDTNEKSVVGYIVQCVNIGYTVPNWDIFGAFCIDCTIYNIIPSFYTKTHISTISKFIILKII